MNQLMKTAAFCAAALIGMNNALAPMAFSAPVCLTAQAEEAQEKNAVWDGSADTSWFDAKNPCESYEISTPEQLAGLSQLVNEGNSMSGIRFDLTADIALNDTTKYDALSTQAKADNLFTPIGNLYKDKPFCGVFNGNGHTIDGLFVNAPADAGLFGYVYTGAVLRTVLTNAHVQANNVDGKEIHAGGIAAVIDGAVLNECEYNGFVMAMGNSDVMSGDHECYAGGLVGMSSITDTSAAGAFLLALAGGFLVNPMLLNDGSGGMIKQSGILNCSQTGAVYGKSKSALNMGGLIGYFHTGQIQNCISLSDVYTQDSQIGDIGKFAGEIGNCTIFHCLYSNYKIDSKRKAIADYDPISIAGDIDKEENARQLAKIEIDKLTALDDEAFADRMGSVLTAVNGEIHAKSIRSQREKIYGAAGDANGDSSVDIIDVITVNKSLMGSELIGEAEQLRADINGNGVPDETDSLIILKHVVEIIPELKY